MGLFGRKEPSAVEAKEQRLQEIENKISARVKELDTQIAGRQKLLSDIKREAAKISSESGSRLAEVRKEENALKALRAAVNNKLKLAEKKEAQVRQTEQKIADREKVLRSEEARIEKLGQQEKALRANILALQQAFDEKKEALDERQRAVVNLTREMNNLLQKRDALQRLEADMKEALLKERESRLNVAKMERRVADGARILSDLEAKTEGHRRILDQSTAQVREMNNLKKQIEDELAQRKKDIQAAKRELLEMENAVKGILMSKDEMQKKTAVLAQREHQLAEQESRIDQKKKELESKRLNLENAERTKQEVSALMEEKKHVLGELKTAVGQNGQLLKEIHEREQKARKAEHDALIAQRESDKKLKMLDSKEKDVTRKEATWTDHEKALKEAIQLLAKDKKDFVDEVNARKAEFLLLSQEWEKKFKDLQEEKRALQVEKTDVRKLVETDVLGLKEKEDELVETIAMLERDKDKLEFEERALLKRVGELERAKAALEKEQKSLGAREKRIIDGERIVQKGMKYIEAEKRKVEHEKDAAYRARELRKVLPKMEHRYEELRRAIAKLEARAMETGARPAMSRVLREREKELEMKEKGIHVEVGRLMEREREVEELEARKEKAFSTYLREEVERVQQGKPGREIVNPEIHAMIDDAREKVMQGRLDDAVRLVAEAEYLAEKVQNSEQRRMLMYDIRDLKASIKLASLT